MYIFFTHTLNLLQLLAEHMQDIIKQTIIRGLFPVLSGLIPTTFRKLFPTKESMTIANLTFFKMALF